MKYKFCSIHVNATKYDVTFATKGGSNPTPPVATPLVQSALVNKQGRSQLK